MERNSLRLVDVKNDSLTQKLSQGRRSSV